VNKRYSSLFGLDPTDYEGWAKGLKKAGYATNPRYPDLLIKYIELYNLQQYSLAALNELPKMDIEKTVEGDAVLPEEVTELATVVEASTKISADPGKIITINKTKCVYVQKGTSILAFANKNRISLNKLMEFNDMTEEGILGKDQILFLHRKQKTGEKEFYIVQPGETVYDIAQKTGVQLKYLLEYNNLNNAVKLGANTKLFLQPGLKTAVKDTEEKKAKVHFVAPKEGLYAIAKAYNVTVQQIKEWNKLNSDNLKIGQELIVSK